MAPSLVTERRPVPSTILGREFLETRKRWPPDIARWLDWSFDHGALFNLHLNSPSFSEANIRDIMVELKPLFLEEIQRDWTPELTRKLAIKIQGKLKEIFRRRRAEKRLIKRDRYGWGLVASEEESTTSNQGGSTVPRGNDAPVPSPLEVPLAVGGTDVTTTTKRIRIDSLLSPSPTTTASAYG
ncbi:hypothetical protein H2202_007644 [Exophiala xenobiotica]|nr:hypothetical protein H2202_007644 [Exophiala xenobiotica]